MARKTEPRIIGHRIARGLLPENTLPGLAYLRAAGIDAAEVDVRITADGVVVLCHDPAPPRSLARDAAGRWIEGPEVARARWADLARLDMGAADPHGPVGRAFPEQTALSHVPMPRLADLLAAAEGLGLFLEIKSESDGAAALRCAHAVAAAVAMRADTTVLSFDARVGRALATLAPDLRFGLLTGPGAPGEAPAGGRLWAPHHAQLTPQAVARAQAAGQAVVAWTVNAPADIARMLRLGVDGIISDYPARVTRALYAGF